MIDLIFSQDGAMVFTTAAIFTVFGWYLCINYKIKDVTELVINQLIVDGYLKTRGAGKNLEILKCNEWDNKNQR